MLKRRRKKFIRSSDRGTIPVVEALEARKLMTVAVNTVIHPDIMFAATNSASSSTAVSGYTPAEIRKAYGFDKIALSNGATADGAGQTIAIVDAYNDPNIVADLGVFDSQFGLPAAQLSVVNQSGGSSLPTTDSGWAGEISLDVEWAHAIAPQAKILLVEAKTSDIANLMGAVDYARHAVGVSVVSMSWGGSEFFSWYGGGESASQTNYDPYFTTPAGHIGVTFVASAGDSGANSGVQWPASSPNVLSVGGTTLTTDSAGTYVSEQSWSGTNGGYSQIENQPAYQNNVQSSGVRSVPDVAYNADPNSGFAIYDSVKDQNQVGWQQVGGTSAGSPQWASLIAIIDQSRKLAGNSTLDGATQTLPMLYTLYNSPGTSGYSSYTQDFHDVIDYTSSNPWQWPWGFGNAGSLATSGYDTMTGLGSPHSDALAAALTGSSSSSNSGGSSGTSGSGGTSGTTTTPTPLVLPNSSIAATFAVQPPASILGGSNGVLKLDLTNTSLSRFTGPITITLYESTDNVLSSDDTAVISVALPKVNIGGGKSRILKVPYSISTHFAAGSYYLIATIDTTGTNTNPSQAISQKPVAVEAPTVDLSTAFGTTPIVVKEGHDGVATVTIDNLGNVAANGTISLSLFASTDEVLNSTDSLISSVITRSIHLRSNHSVTFHVRFLAPLNAAPGTYSIIASMTSTLTFADNNSSNDMAVAETTAA